MQKRMNRGGKKQAGSSGFQFAENPALDPAEIGDTEIRSAYRMNLDPHMGFSHPCKKNCR